MPVRMLQTLAGERRATGRGTDQEPTGHLVTRRPQLVAGALEAEHRVEDVDGHEWLACLLYTSDAADDLLCVDFGGRRIIKKKKNYAQQNTNSDVVNDMPRMLLILES